MKKIFFAAFLILVVVFFSCSFSTASESETKAFNWYVNRNTEHKQPILDTNLDFISKYHAYYVDPRCKEEKVLYLTFDAGYENGNVEKIVDILIEEKVNGAFFVLENLITKHPELVQKMKENGLLVCNHTMYHRDMSTVHSREEFSEELEALEGLYQDCTGSEMPKFYRPPEGRFSEQNLKDADALGYKTVFWSFAYADWDNQNQPSEKYAKKKILDNVHNGAILLLHPTSATNASILQELIQQWKQEGYRFASLNELDCKQISS